AVGTGRSALGLTKTLDSGRLRWAGRRPAPPSFPGKPSKFACPGCRSPGNEPGARVPGPGCRPRAAAPVADDPAGRSRLRASPDGREPEHGLTRSDWRRPGTPRPTGRPLAPGEPAVGRGRGSGASGPARRGPDGGCGPVAAHHVRRL